MKPAVLAGQPGREAAMDVSTESGAAGFSGAQAVRPAALPTRAETTQRAQFHCVLCGGRQAQGIGRNPDFPESNLVVCRGCGLIGSDPLPPDECLDQIYREHYRAIRREKPTAEYLRDLDCRAEAQLLFATGSGVAMRRLRVLDVGCAAGSFLKLCRPLADSLTGFEPDEVMREAALERLPPTTVVHETLFRRERLEEQQFDWIVASHVLEHVRDPVAFLTDLLEVLSSGGIVLVEVPNEDLETARGWAESGVPGRMHLWGFNPSTLESAAEAAGGRLLRWATFGEAKARAGNSRPSTRAMKQKFRRRLQGRFFGPVFDGLHGLRQARLRRRRRRMMFTEQGSRGECLRTLIARADS